MVQKPAHLLHRFTGFPPELGRRVAKDMYTSRWQPGVHEIPAQVAIECPAGDTAPTIGTRWPQGFVWLQGGKFLAEGFQSLLYGPESGLGQLPLAMLASLASVAVIDGVSIKIEVLP